MDRGQRGNQLLRNRNNKIYMGLRDIIRENALHFLPAKSLYRFRKVCRDWKLQISTPFFAHNQSYNFRDVSGIFYQSGSKQPSFVSLDPNACGVPDPVLSFLPEPVDIRTSSHGLLCCQGRSGDKAYYICNPATKQWKKLPKPNAVHGSNPAIVLIFEPSLLNFVAEYKLVCAFPCVELDDGYEFDIYSSKEGSWKVSKEIFLGSKKLLPRSGVHVNGIVYWQTTEGGVFLFDLTKERTHVVTGVYGSYSFYGSGSLGVLNGKLCFVHNQQLGLIVHVLSNPYTNTMGMHSMVKTWEEKRQILFNSSVVSNHASTHFDTQKVLFAGGNCLFFQIGGKLCSYDMKTEEFKCLLAEVVHDIKIAGYVNSLVEI